MRPKSVFSYLWYHNGKVIASGDPENPLGSRWMRLTGTEDSNRNYKGYGIHGTKDRSSIGQNASNGCIRMLNEEVEELYDIIKTSVPVIIEK